MTVIVRPSKELIEYFKHRMLGCVISHMMVKPDIDVDRLLSSLVEYFYREYGLRHSLDKEIFKEIANSVKQYIKNRHNSKNEVV